MRSNSRLLSLRWHLMFLLIGTLVPVLLFATALVLQLSQEARAASERRLVIAANIFANEIDREISGTLRTLQAMAESENLDGVQLNPFYVEAKRAARTQPSWMLIILATPDGRQVVNTGLPFGTALPRVNEPASFHRVVSLATSAVGNLKRGQRGGQLAFPVRVPVERNGKLKYILSAVLSPDALAEIVARQVLTEGEWTRTVVDGTGVVVARSRAPKRFVGRPASPEFIQKIQRSAEGFFQSVTLDDVKVYTAFKRLDTASWTAAVSVPRPILEAPQRNAMSMILILGAVMLLLSGLGALLLSSRISRPIASATNAAQALAKGESPQVRHADIQEVAELGAALESSSRLLLQREHERNDLLARAESARDEAEKANRLKDYFLAALSHELRSPLTSILGWAKMMRSGQLDESIQSTSIETIERNAEALAALVDDLLDMSRITTNKLHLDIQILNMAQIVSQATDSIRPSAEAKNIHLSLEAEEGLSVSGDPIRLQQVVWNLLSNAVKFTPEGGSVEVNLSKVDKQLILNIRDRGVGIAPEFLPHVFDRFRQADGTSTRRFGGLGLGLSLVRSLVELHGGTVQADSEGEGAGATFTVKLPLAEAPAKDERLHSSPLQEPKQVTAEYSRPLVSDPLRPI